jgi:hypothetical protein
MGTSQFVFAKMLPGKWASSDNRREFLRPAFLTGGNSSRTLDPNEEAGSAGKTKAK